MGLFGGKEEKEKKKKAKMEERYAQDKIRERKRQDKDFKTDGIVHLSGLPLSEEALCNIFISGNDMNIESENKNINLKIDRMLNLEFEVDERFDKEVSSSVG